MSNTAETPTIIQPDVSANRATNLRKRLFTWFAEQRLHCIVFIAYVTVTVTVSCFHEPWFDEAQAWLIARDCSWKELLTVRTHYEGHPPLWWMLLAIPAIDCDIEKINSNDWPQWIRNLNNRVMTLLGPKKTERYLHFFKILGLIFMLVSVYWTASASICDIRYDYSSSRAVASFIKTNHLEQYRWMAGWTRVSKNDTASNPEINKIIDKGGYCGGTDCIDYTSWYGSTLIDSAPYFDHTLLANAYKGRSYSSWEWCVDPYAGKKDIETWKSWGEPEFYDTLYQPFFFSDLGYDRNHYTKIKIAETKTPWKSTWSEGACEIYVRNDIYENVLHSPDPGIDWPDGATRR